MKINIKLNEEELIETPIAFAEAVICHFMDGVTDRESMVLALEALDEVECYLRVFNAHHPLYEYEEMLNGKA